MRDVFALIGLIILFIYFLNRRKLENKLIDYQRRQKALVEGKNLYTDSKFRIRDTISNRPLYRLLLHTKGYNGEYWCYNADIFNPQVHSKIGKGK